MYHHLMFDMHEVLLAEGIPTESFFPGDYILQDTDLHDEISTLFPEMIGTVDGTWETARRVLRRQEAQVLCGDRMLAV